MPDLTAANAARALKAQRRRARWLRERGWTCLEPGDSLTAASERERERTMQTWQDEQDYLADIAADANETEYR